MVTVAWNLAEPSGDESVALPIVSCWNWSIISVILTLKLLPLTSNCLVIHSPGCCVLGYDSISCQIPWNCNNEYIKLLIKWTKIQNVCLQGVSYTINDNN